MPTYEDVALGTSASPAAVVLSNGHQPTDPLAPVQVELDDYFHRLTTLGAMPTTECFQTLSAISARASEVRSRLMAMDSRRSTSMRLRHVDPLLEEVDRQFKIWSRIQAVRQFEWDASGGQT